jgi:phosphoribosylanthranilate isomerase
MTTFVKICGLTGERAVAAALEAGADAVGFVLFVPASPRNIEPADFVRLSSPARGRAKVVIVTAGVLDARVSDLVRGVEPDAIQLHGSETPAQVQALRDDLGLDRSCPDGLEIWKGLAVGAPADLADAADFGAADRLLLDAKPPKGAERTGGHGLAFDWSILAGWASPKPWILSGGLTPETVADAVHVTGATAVDVSSGVEASPGVKDPAKVRAFVAAAKAARPSAGSA